MTRRWRGVAATAAACVLGAQLIQPGVENPPAGVGRSLWSDPHTDRRVASLLRRACANCHSNETQWPWYARVSPVSWMIARHVSRGRRKLNFSEWRGAAGNELQEIGDAIEKGEMPPAGYRLMHPEARLSPEERAVLLNWVDGKVETSGGSMGHR